MQIVAKLFHKLIYLRLFLLSIVAALALSLVSLYSVVRISDVVVEDYRYGYLLYMARSIEKTSLSRPISRIKLDKLAESSFEEGSSPLLEAAEFGISSPEGMIGEANRPNQPLLWIVSNSGKVLSTNSGKVLPLKWSELPHPKKIHAITSNDNVLFKPKTFVVKLNTMPTTYLISHNAGFLFQGPFLWIQGVHTFTTAALAMFLALSITFFYLRKKSRAARAVLARLEQGDLKARFEIKRFDEFGSLLLDFNRMAIEIERLVKKVNNAEKTRSNLLQELGHDVRTPLTSLSTSFETLRAHHDELSLEDRNELYQMLGADIRYFRDLLEQLTVVSTIDVPNYKASTEAIDLESLLEEEVKNRQTSSGELIKWKLENPHNEKTTLLGDGHLITRLFRNAFDNASRYATNAVSVRLETFKDRIEVFIMDDGPGLSDEAIASFGKRRERRQVKERDAENFSLGLGSVIMKAIAEVHDGFVSISNINHDSPSKGACLKVTFVRK